MTIATQAQGGARSQLGVIEGEGGVVTDYIEKPTLDYEVSMGIYVYSPRAIELIPTGRFDFPDLVLALIEAGEKVCRYHFDGTWYDIGTIGELELATTAYNDDAEISIPPPIDRRSLDSKSSVLDLSSVGGMVCDQRGVPPTPSSPRTLLRRFLLWCADPAAALAATHPFPARPRQGPGR